MSKKIFRSLMGAAVLAALASALFPGAARAGDPADELFVLSGGRIYVLGETEAASGERFASDDGSAEFWSKGGEAALTVNDREIPRYVLIRGTDADDEIVLTADGANYRMKQVVTASGAKYEAAGDPDTYFWSKGASATLMIGGKRYAGYDAWLPYGGIWIPGEPVPAGVKWRVRSIGGADVIDGSGVTLTFGSDGRLFGKASVNNYSAPWISAGGRLLVSTVISTKMMGPENLARQEHEYLKALQNVKRFRLLGPNELELTTDEGAAIVLER
jgi:heat shock protein HslJ/membrane-bound inhibitor of C-type lysozyme